MSAVDIVISTYNRPIPLERCLAGLAAQTVRHFRVIVVDDCSNLPVEPVVRAARAGGLDVTYIRTPENGGPARGRNLGVAGGFAPIILFLDDDVVPEDHLVERHIRSSAPGTVVIGPLVAPADWRPTPWNDWEARTLAVEYDRMSRGDYAPTWRQLFTGNASMHRADFLAAGGFDEGFPRAEDIELGLRLSRHGCVFTFEPRAVGWHYAHRTLRSWCAIPGQYARADVAIDELYPDAGWLENLARERGERSGLLGATVAAARAGRLERPAVWAAIAGARMLHRAGAAGAAMRGLSFAYEVLYQRSLRAVRSERTGPRLPPRQRLGGPVGC